MDAHNSQLSVSLALERSTVTTKAFNISKQCTDKSADKDIPCLEKPALILGVGH